MTSCIRHSNAAQSAGSTQLHADLFLKITQTVHDVLAVLVMYFTQDHGIAADPSCVAKQLKWECI